jgi:LysM repeat protein
MTTPPYVPQVVVSPQQPKGVPKAFIAIASVVLAAALGGGAYTVFHKKDPGPVKPGPEAAPATAAATPFFSPSGGAYVPPQTVKVTIHDSTPDAKIHFTTDGSTPSASSPEYSGPITVASQETLKAIATAPGFSDSSVGSGTYVFAAAPPPIVVPKEVPKPVVKVKPPATLASGTLTWNGSVPSGTHLTIVRSANQVWKAGQLGQPVGTLSGSMFPAGGIEAHVTGGHAILVLPKAATNYNSMEMFTSDTGQQTIVIHWKALPNSQ